MRHPIYKALCGLFLLALCHCGGGGGSDCCSDNSPSASVCASDANWTSSIALSTVASIVTNATQTYNLTATADKKIAAYLINESSTAPSSDDGAWTAVTKTKDFSASDISHTLADTADGEKTVYAWFKDECGDISPSANTSFTLDVTGPAGTLSLDSGAKFTLESDLDVTVAISATGEANIVAYALTDTNAEPASDSADWVSVTAATSLSVNTTRTLPNADRANTVYGWVKNVAGQVSAVSDEIEVMRIFRDTGPVNFGTFSSIAVDSSQIAHFTCYAATDGILAVNIESISLADAIDNEQIDPPGGVAGNYGRGTSIAIDANDNIHIVYRDVDNEKLKYATNASGAWVLFTIEDGGISPEIAIDTQGFVHIAHQHGSEVRYVTNKTGGWVSEAVYDDGGFDADSIVLKMTLDTQDKPHLLYTAFLDKLLVHLTNASGSWQTDTVFIHTGGVPRGNALGANGDQLLAVFGKDSGKLFYSDKSTSGTSWSTPVEIDPVVAGYSAVAADSNEIVHVAYYTPISKDLKYATNLSGTWVNTTIDFTGDVGSYVSLAIDSNNRLHISYYDTTRTVLVYATTADAP